MKFELSDATVVFSQEPKLGGQTLAVDQQDLHRCRIGGPVAAGEQAWAGLGFGRVGVKAGPVAVTDLGVHPDGDLGN